VDAESGVAVWTLTNAVPAGSAAFVINDVSAETVTRIEGMTFTTGANQQPHSVSSRRMLHRNPWLPHLIDTWSEWKTIEGLEPRGAPFETTVLYNAQGLPVVTRTHKVTADRHPAEKIAFAIPRATPDQWQTANVAYARQVQLPLYFTNASRA